MKTKKQVTTTNSAKPIAVLISDVHFNLNTLDRATFAMNVAIDRANNLEVPLIVAGDLHDTKANLRAECVKAMLECFARCQTPASIMVGNHDKINEKSEGHSLEFLRDAPGVNFLVDAPFLCSFKDGPKQYLIPYQHNLQSLEGVLASPEAKSASIFIMHQGVTGSNSGEYFKDPTAIPAEFLAGKRVISGHYHTRQQFALPDGGLFDYVGNPYTLGFGEAKDPAKGFQVLNDDGSLEFVPIDLPAHRVVKMSIQALREGAYLARTDVNNKDIVKVVLDGPADVLSTVKKEEIADVLGFSNFQLELDPTAVSVADLDTNVPKSDDELFDYVIDAANVDDARKERLKKLWRQI